MKGQSSFAQFEDSANGFSIRTTLIPELKTGEVLVRNTYTTICRSDIYTFQGKRKEKSPTILGHEIVGKIVALGPDAPFNDLRGQVLKIGDRITWGIYASNPDSVFAKKGIPQKGEDLFKYGHEQITEHSTLHGGLAEYIILRKNTPIIAIQDDALSNKAASLINCAVATAAGAIRLAGSLENQTVLVNGAGMLGIIACAMAHKAGARKVIAVDFNKDRANLALKFGADLALGADEPVLSSSPAADGVEKLKVDVVLEFSGIPEAMKSTLELLDIGGTAVWIGATFPQPDIAINGEKMIRRVLTIRGLHNYNQSDLVAAVDFMESSFNDFDFDSLVHGGFSLEQTAAAYQYAIDHNPFRVGIDLVD
jgi:alcohol dehydrogenase